MQAGDVGYKGEFGEVDLGQETSTYQSSRVGKKH